MKTSNGMKKFFLNILPLAISLVIFPAVSFLPAQASAQVRQIVFITDPQTIKPNTVSEPITIQTQNEDDGSVQTPETLDIQFISTSATGEFLNSSGNPATTYMSKNTANRTFYYRDSTEGTFTIKISVKGRESGMELNTSQKITVSSGASQNSSDNKSNSSGEVLGASDSSSAKTAISGESTTHVSSPNAQLEVVAGSDRTTSPGSPIWFQATVKKNTTSMGVEMDWAFGDGNVGVGPLVSHTYKYPGDFVVVLSAVAGNTFSVSRFRVKVFEPKISVSEEDEYLNISNDANTEINLFNWKIGNKTRGFIFQPNTIILPHSSIKLDKSLLKMKGMDDIPGISLKNSLGEEVFAVAPAMEVDLSEVSESLDSIKKELSIMQEKVENMSFAVQDDKPKAQSEDPVIPKDSARASSQQANVLSAATTAENVIYEAPRGESFLKRSWNFITGLFD